MINDQEIEEKVNLLSKEMAVLCDKWNERGIEQAIQMMALGSIYYGKCLIVGLKAEAFANIAEGMVKTYKEEFGERYGH